MPFYTLHKITLSAISWNCPTDYFLYSILSFSMTTVLNLLDCVCEREISWASVNITHDWQERQFDWVSVGLWVRIITAVAYNVILALPHLSKAEEENMIINSSSALLRWGSARITYIGDGTLVFWLKSALLSDFPGKWSRSFRRCSAV